MNTATLAKTDTEEGNEGPKHRDAANRATACRVAGSRAIQPWEDVAISTYEKAPQRRVL